MTVLAAIPSPTQGVWELGPLPLRAYALCIVAGIVAAVLITEKRWVARGGAPGDVLDIAVWAVPFGIIGGRIYHVISSPRAYFGEGGDPLRAFAIWEGGLGIWGAIAFGGVGAWIACRRRGIPLPAFADALAPGLLVAQAIGRLGNWFNNELYGGPTDLPWALTIYEWDGGRAVARRRRRAGRRSGTFHPTFLYELLWNLAAAALVVWADRRFQLSHGRAFALYVVVLLRRPAVDRAAAHRPGRDVLRGAAQRLHLDRRRPARRRLPGLAARPAAGGHRPRARGRPGTDGAAVPAGPAEDARPDGAVTMITGAADPG